MTKYPSKKVKDSFRLVHLPYCIQRQGEKGYVILNRHYKPLGYDVGVAIEREDFPKVKLKITPAVAKELSYKGSDDIQGIYLYNDGCVPNKSAKAMVSYMKRLAVLEGLGVKIP